MSIKVTNLTKIMELKRQLAIFLLALVKERSLVLGPNGQGKHDIEDNYTPVTWRRIVGEVEVCNEK
jgi:hypothetical protein